MPGDVFMIVGKYVDFQYGKTFDLHFNVQEVPIYTWRVFKLDDDDATGGESQRFSSFQQNVFEIFLLDCSIIGLGKSNAREYAYISNSKGMAPREADTIWT